jgi:hypothetical protein
MAENQSSIDLSLATIEDIVAELQKRRLEFALFVDHVAHGSSPGGDVRWEERFGVYSAKKDSDPAEIANLLCNGIQWCLGHCDERDGVVDLSIQIGNVSKALLRIWEQRKS